MTGSEIFIGQRVIDGVSPVAKSRGGFCGMGKNTVTLLDRLLAIPVAIYFWWHEQRQKLMRRATKKDD
jgi:hypothetical protein